MGEKLEELSKCNRCGICDAYCPTYRASGRAEFSPSARIEAASKILSGEAKKEHLVPVYSCTLCGMCTRICPKGVDIPKLMELCRIALYESGLAPLPQHHEIIDSILRYGNSVKKPRETRWSWLPAEYEFLFEKKSPLLLFIGCLPSYLTKEIATSTIELLLKIGVEFRLYREEECCGAPLLNYGDQADAREIIEANKQLFEKEGIEELLVVCPGCYRTFEREYKGFEVKHVVHLLYELYEKGELELEKLDLEYTYHDPCHLGREYGLYDEPRALLEASGRLIEMEESRDKAFCCGADAGVRPAFKNLSISMATERLRQARDKAEVLVTSCPFCLFNLNYTNLKLGLGLRIAYLTEILLEALKSSYSRA